MKLRTLRYKKIKLTLHKILFKLYTMLDIQVIFHIILHIYKVNCIKLLLKIILS